MNQVHAKVQGVERIRQDVFLLKLYAPSIASCALPGEFLHVKVASFPLLRRPFSIHRVTDRSIYILFKVRGKGTRLLAKKRKGEYLDVIGPLGRGFSYSGDERIAIVTGGMGVAPFLFLLDKWAFTHTTVLIGAKTKKDVLCEREFLDRGAEVIVATEDGSRGFKGTVVDLLKEFLSSRLKMPSCIYTCGPKQMFAGILKVLRRYPLIRCEASFEQFMGCGMGFCHACVVRSRQGYRRVCKEGPVFDLRDFRSRDLVE